MSNLDKMKKRIEKKEKKDFDVEKEIEEIKQTLSDLIELIKTRNF